MLKSWMLVPLGVAIFAVALWFASTHATPAGVEGAVGTTGAEAPPETGTRATLYERVGEEDAAGPTMTPSTVDGLPAVLDDETERLVGRHVRVAANVQNVDNDVAFWATAGGQRVLVVMARDRRSGSERQRGLPSRSPLGFPKGTDRVTVSGTVQPLPAAEEMYSWGLTRADEAELVRRKIYIRADQIG